MTPIEQVDNAIHLLERDGWGRGEYLNVDTGCRCFLGALYDFQKNASGHPVANEELLFNTSIDKALTGVLDHGPITWNDDICESKEQAIEKLKELREQVKLLEDERNV